MSTELAKTEEQLPATVAQSDGSTASIMLAAVAAGADKEQMLMVREAIEFSDERDHKATFYAAKLAAHRDLRSVFKSAKGHNGTYASYDDIVEEVNRCYNPEGIMFHHERDERPDGSVSMTCHLTHENGFGISSSMTAPPDTSGSKNAIQAIASTRTYLKRYTLEDVAGISTTKNDNDGRDPSPPAELLTEEQVLKIDEQLGYIGEAFGDEVEAGWRKRMIAAHGEEGSDKLATISRNKYEEIMGYLHRKLTEPVE